MVVFEPVLPSSMRTASILGLRPNAEVGRFIRMQWHLAQMLPGWHFHSCPGLPPRSETVWIMTSVARL